MLLFQHSYSHEHFTRVKCTLWRKSEATHPPKVDHVGVGFEVRSFNWPQPKAFDFVVSLCKCDLCPLSFPSMSMILLCQHPEASSGLIRLLIRVGFHVQSLLSMLGSTINKIGETYMIIHEGFKNAYFDNESYNHMRSETYEKSDYNLNMD
jgi:hypothetical protein